MRPTSAKGPKREPRRPPPSEGRTSHKRSLQLQASPTLRPPPGPMSPRQPTPPTPQPREPGNLLQPRLPLQLRQQLHEGCRVTRFSGCLQALAGTLEAGLQGCDFLLRHRGLPGSLVRCPPRDTGLGRSPHSLRGSSSGLLCEAGRAGFGAVSLGFCLRGAAPLRDARCPSHLHWPLPNRRASR